MGRLEKTEILQKTNSTNTTTNSNITTTITANSSSMIGSSGGCNSSGDNESDASKMLQAALQQMDGIISGASNRNTSSPDIHITNISPTNVLAAAQALSMVLQQCGNMAPSPDPITAGIINTWLETHLPVRPSILNTLKILCT